MKMTRDTYSVHMTSNDNLYSPSHGSKNIIIIIIIIINSIEIKDNINNTSANMLKTVQRRGNCINYWTNASQHFNLKIILEIILHLKRKT